MFNEVIATVLVNNPQASQKLAGNKPRTLVGDSLSVILHKETLTTKNWWRNLCVVYCLLETPKKVGGAYVWNRLGGCDCDHQSAKISTCQMCKMLKICTTNYRC